MLGCGYFYCHFGLELAEDNDLETRLVGLWNIDAIEVTSFQAGVQLDNNRDTYNSGEAPITFFDDNTVTDAVKTGTWLVLENEQVNVEGIFELTLTIDGATNLIDDMTFNVITDTDTRQVWQFIFLEGDFEVNYAVELSR